ncbi:MAG TPA: TonB family protein, partial [Phenylobacterium sp.]
VEIGGDADTLHGQTVSIWPAQARAMGITGHVTLSCNVDVHGLAESCRVAAEDPPGRGFGKAALALRPTFKLTPKQGRDGPEDSTMNIAVNFDAKQTESNFQQVMARSAGQGAMPPEDGNSGNSNGHHEINARDLVIFHQPAQMRRVTLMDSRGWAQAPGFDDWAAAYPADGGGVEGYAVAHCKMLTDGALTHCVVAKETPVNHGFGRAAVALAAKFRVSPEVMAQAPRGAPVEVDVPVRFPPPAEARDRTVRAPVWVNGYDLATLLRDFNPPGAKPVSPGAVVKCQVGSDGGLTGCAAELTSPDGIAYDRAAVELASRLKMTLWSAEAGPVAGGVVHVVVKRDASGG